MFAQMCDKPIQAHQMITEGETILLETRLFANQYEQWQSLPPADRTWPKFEEYWTSKIDLWIKCRQTARQLGYGGNVEAITMEYVQAEQAYYSSLQQFSAVNCDNAAAFNQLSNTNAQIASNIMAAMQ